MAAHTYTFGDQLDLLSVLLGDPNTSADDMFPLALRKTYINRGELHFSVDSKCLREYASGTIASQEISCPSDWIKSFVLVVNSRDVTKFEIALQDYERYLNDSEYRWYKWSLYGTDKKKFIKS